MIAWDGQDLAAEDDARRRYEVNQLKYTPETLDHGSRMWVPVKVFVLALVVFLLLMALAF